jgi:hypothetical protein
MRGELAVAALLLAVTACGASRSEETRRVGEDTVVTTRREVDTTIIRTDTTITVDTTRRVESDR